MRKIFLVFFMLFACCTLSGCAMSLRPEHQAYVISLSLDRVKTGELMLAAQIPVLGGTGGGSGGGSGSGGESGQDASSPKSDYLTATATAASFAEALDLMQATVPRKLQLSQLKSLVVSQELAREISFPHLVDELMLTYHLYGASAVIVCTGNAMEFIKAQESTIGPRLSSSVTAAFQHFEQNGYMAITTLYELYASTHSWYSDPILTLAATADGVNFRAMPAGRMGAALPGTLPRGGENKNEYMGAALMRKGRMVGVLNGLSTQWLKILRRDKSSLSYICQGRSVKLTARKPPVLSVECGRDGVTVLVDLTLTVTPLLEDPNPEALKQSIARDIDDLFRQCQSLSVEPFGLTELAAMKFLTVADFSAYQFREKFARAPLSLTVTLVS